MKISHNHALKTAQIATHLVAIPAIVWAVMGGHWHWLIVSWLTYWFIGIMGINVGFHRFLSHGAFKTYKPFEYLMLFCGMITTVGSPLAWVIVHRIHHKHTDGEHDPHSPHDIGILKAWFGVWNSSGYKYAGRVSKKIRRDKIYVKAHEYYFHVLIAWAILLYLTLGWQGVAFVYCIPAVASLHSACGIVVIPHIHGYINHDLSKRGDTSRNSWIANIITMGEGWHNNHHANPGRWNTREKWWEWDIPAQVIKLIHRRDCPLPKYTSK